MNPTVIGLGACANTRAGSPESNVPAPMILAVPASTRRREISPVMTSSQPPRNNAASPAHGLRLDRLRKMPSTTARLVLGSENTAIASKLRNSYVEVARVEYGLSGKGKRHTFEMINAKLRRVEMRAGPGVTADAIRP